MALGNHRTNGVNSAITHHFDLTILADDRPGIVERIAQTITVHRGSWARVSMTRLGGKFAGLLLVDIDDSRKQPLIEELKSLDQDADGIPILVDQSPVENPPESVQLTTPRCVQISIIANDRQGIVGEITGLLAANKVNLEWLDSFCQSAPMAAGNMFHARAELRLPETISRTKLTELLESLSDDLMMEIQQKD